MDRLLRRARSGLTTRDIAGPRIEADQRKADADSVVLSTIPLGNLLIVPQPDARVTADEA